MEKAARHQQQQQQLGSQQQEILAASPATLAPFGSQLAAQNKRKEKARIAARARRSQEANIIMEMANELHITQEKIRRIDKATIVKLAIDYIKAFEILCRLRGSSTTSSSCGSEDTTSTSASTITSHNSDNSDSSISSSSSRSSSNRHSTCCTCCCCYSDTSSLDHATSAQLTRHSTKPDQHAPEQHQQQQQQQQRPVSTTTQLPIGKRDRQTLKQAAPYSSFKQQPPVSATAYSAPKLNTGSIFAPKTQDMDSHFLVIADDARNGQAALILKPDTEILDEDDLTHLAPQAGDASISLDAEPLDGIELDTSLFLGSQSPPMKKPLLLDSGTCYIGPIGTVD